AADEQPVVNEAAADLGERARQVVDAVQRKQRDDEIEALRGEGNELLVRHDGGLAGESGAGKIQGRSGAQNVLDLSARRERRDSAAMRRAEVEGLRKAALDGREP